MQVRDLLPSEVEAARRFLSAHGWEARVGDEANFASLIANSQRTAVAIEEGRIIGFARAITDSVSNGYISMVVVSPEHRRQGIGRALVRHVMGANPGITWVLRAGRKGAKEFFSKLGFRSSLVAMERERG